MVKKLLHTRYRVADLDRTVSFYKDVLGLIEVGRHTSGRGSQLVFLKAPASEELIEICKYDQSGPVVVGPDLTHLAFEVEDLEEFARAAAEKGYPLSDGPPPQRERQRHRLHRRAGRLRDRVDRTRQITHGFRLARFPF